MGFTNDQAKEEYMMECINMCSSHQMNGHGTSTHGSGYGDEMHGDYE